MRDQLQEIGDSVTAKCVTGCRNLSDSEAAGCGIGCRDISDSVTAECVTGCKKSEVSDKRCSGRAGCTKPEVSDKCGPETAVGKALSK